MDVADVCGKFLHMFYFPLEEHIKIYSYIKHIYVLPTGKIYKGSLGHPSFPLANLALNT